jgi:predicted 2-oxoglutarate/Fe(II)-dependent dioxygenase YbiX
MNWSVTALDPEIFTVEDVLDRAECRELIERGEALGFQAATVPLEYGPTVMPGVRNNERVLFDDRALADALWERVRELVPPEIDGWRAHRLNDRLRFYRYDPGQRFKRHKDGIVALHSGEESRLSFLMYLNDDFEGGETIFIEYPDKTATEPSFRLVVKPRTGLGLFFRHQRWHEGAPIVEGRKYVLRSDVFYLPPV